MVLRPEKRSPANQRLVDVWDTLPIDLPYSAEEFIDLIDTIDVISLFGVPDGKDLAALALIVDAIRKMCGLEYEQAKDGLIRAFDSMPGESLF